MLRACALGAVLLLASACGGEGGTAADRGQRVYTANCTACHNQNPAIPGVLGPAVAGSSPALLESRVLRGEYPPGYTPKADTNLMQPMPFLAGEIGALSAFLNGP